MIQNFVLNHSFFGVGSVIESTPHFFTQSLRPGFGSMCFATKSSAVTAQVLRQHNNFWGSV